MNYQGTEALVFMQDAALAIEKLRVESEIALTHILNNRLDALVASKEINKDRATQIRDNWAKKRIVPEDLRAKLLDPERYEVRRRLVDLENYMDGRIANLITSHPAYPWFSRVKGVGEENIGKVVALIDIAKAPTISSLWRFAGWSVEDGVAPRRVKGQKLIFNSQLRTMCWRLATSLKRARGKFYKYYIEEKEKYIKRFQKEGYKILPTPQGKWFCLNCGESWARKRDITLCCGQQSIEKQLRQEPPGVKWVGHVDAMAVRKMIKLFLGCLWLVWREAVGLPIRNPYAIDRKGHTKLISPWAMVDK